MSGTSDKLFTRLASEYINFKTDLELKIVSISILMKDTVRVENEDYVIVAKAHY